MDRSNIYLKYKKEHPACEKCGRYIGVEVHHIIPFSSCGDDSYDNFISLCCECHDKAHIKDRSDLVKKGIEVARSADYVPYVNLHELLVDIYNSADDIDTPSHVVDIILRQKRITKKGQYYGNGKLPKTSEVFFEQNLIKME